MSEPVPTTWSCEVGPADRAALPGGADLPMRQAVRAAFHELTGHDPETLSSGWGRIAPPLPATAAEGLLRLPEPDYGLIDNINEAADPDAPVHIEQAASEDAQPSTDTGLDVERLARAISKHHRRTYIDTVDRAAAKHIAKLYALAASEPPAREDEPR